MTQRTCRICRDHIKSKFFLAINRVIYQHKLNLLKRRKLKNLSLILDHKLSIFSSFVACLCTHSLNFHAIYSFSNIKSFLFACKCSCSCDYMRNSTVARDKFISQEGIENQYSPARKASTGTEGYGIGYG